MYYSYSRTAMKLLLVCILHVLHYSYIYHSYAIELWLCVAEMKQMIVWSVTALWFSGSRAEWDHIFKKVRANSYLCLLDKVMLVLIVCRCYVDQPRMLLETCIITRPICSYVINPYVIHNKQHLNWDLGHQIQNELFDLTQPFWNWVCISTV